MVCVGIYVSVSNQEAIMWLSKTYHLTDYHLQCTQVLGTCFNIPVIHQRYEYICNEKMAIYRVILIVLSPLIAVVHLSAKCKR